MSFAYPKIRHIRRLRPKVFKNYKTYKRYLRVEFSATCVYCRLPDTVNLRNSFGIDHYRPVSMFGFLKCVYDNLYYCCPACNSRKGDYWPTPQQLNENIFIPNPCEHSMFDHLRFVKGEAKVRARTSAGKEALMILGLNDQESLRYRELHQRVVENAKLVLNHTQMVLKKLDAQIERHGDVSRWLAKRDRLREELQKAKAHVDALTPTALTYSPSIMRALRAAQVGGD